MAKPRAVALLRAINVGGHTVTMERLRALFAEMGFAGVETLIASGNVVVEAKRGDSARLEARIEASLRQALGYEVATMLRTADEVDDVLRRAPKGGTASGAGVDEVAQSVMVGFLKAPPPSSAAATLKALETDMDSLLLDGRELFWVRTGRISDSKLAGGLLEKTLGTAMTMRNITTVRKIAAKLSGTLGVLIVVGVMSGCVPPFRSTAPEGVRSGLDPVARQQTRRPIEPDTTLLSRFTVKRVSSKREPTTVRASDGTWCTLTAKKFAATAVGGQVLCNWSR